MNQANKTMTVKNRRLKMSPGGMITLPVSARKALRMEKGKGSQVTVAVENNRVILAPTAETGGFRISPKGQLQLRGDARTALEAGKGRHYWIDLDDESRNVELHPFT